MNKNKCICIAALSGLISALSFNINCLWFAIFFSISPVFYVILKYKSHTKLILFNFTLYFIVFQTYGFYQLELIILKISI